MEKMELHTRMSAKSGKNEGNVFCRKNIREKSGDSTNSRDNQGNIREIVSLFFQKIDVLLCRKTKKKTNSANDEPIKLFRHEFYPSCLILKESFIEISFKACELNDSSIQL